MAKGSRGGKYGGGKTDDGLGIGRKGKERSVDAAREAVNPNYSDPDARAKGWRHNCQSCSVTQEALIRGYDVEAVSHAPGSEWYPDENGEQHQWYDAFSGADKDFYTSDGYHYVGKETTLNLHTERGVQREVASWGEGGRGVVSVRWKGGRSSHILNVINGGSEGIYFSDGQDGKRYSLGDILHYASPKTGFFVTRTDTLSFTPDVVYLTKRR